MLRGRPGARLYLAVLLAVALLPGGADFARGAVPADIRGALDKIAKACEIEIVTETPAFPVRTLNGVIGGKAAGKKALEDYAELFVPEFVLYPRDAVKRSRLARVVLCEDLAFAGQRRNAVPDYENDVLYLDVNRGTYSRAYLRKVIHHEYFHVIDYRDDGQVYEDAGWQALNPAGFRYGEGGRAAQGQAETSLLTTAFPGFLTHYSTTAVEEDKAELFAHLVVDPDTVEKRARKDPVIRAKVDRMKNLLARFSSDMKEPFWEKARQVKREGD